MIEYIKIFIFFVLFYEHLPKLSCWLGFKLKQNWIEIGTLHLFIPKPWCVCAHNSSVQDICLFFFKYCCCSCASLRVREQLGLESILSKVNEKSIMEFSKSKDFQNIEMLTHMSEIGQSLNNTETSILNSSL